MNKYDACRILNIQGEYTPEFVKAAYRKACSLYHPDRSPAGLEMMKLVNQAYEALKDEQGKANETIDTQDYGQELCNALNAIMELGLTIELCGAWAWVSGNTKGHKDTLKTNGFKWASKKLMWYFRPADAKTFSRGKKSIDEIRTKYGSKIVSGFRQQDRLTA
jgi:curved DNA-binding protein CbpA